VVRRKRQGKEKEMMKINFRIQESCHEHGGGLIRTAHVRGWKIRQTTNWGGIGIRILQENLLGWYSHTINCIFTILCTCSRRWSCVSLLGQGPWKFTGRRVGFLF
jgi:hypothetical protein